jgi:flagellar hook-associated protein 2
MAAIQLSGLASGFDWKSFVDQLIAAEQTPVATLQNKQYTDSTKVGSWSTISSDLTALQSSAKTLSSEGIFAGRSAKIADSASSWSATASAGTPAGQYSFDVTQLATTAQRVGSSKAGAAISPTNDVTAVTLATMNIATALTTGSFTVNGKQIDIALTDSLDSVLQKISTGTGVTASYEHDSDRIKLTSASPIVLGSAADTSNFLTALKLYNTGTGSIQSTASLGVPNLAASIANSNLKLLPQDLDTNGNGSFTINGVPISFNINTDSLQGVLSRINASGAGVTAAYDKAGDKFTLTNKITGNLGLTASEDPNGLLEALGLNSTASFTSGKNAEFTINNGSPLISTSNILDSSVTGIDGLSVTATTQESQTVNVSADNADARAKIDDFISKFNAVQDYIDAQTKTTVGSDGKVTTSPLSGNSDVTDIQRSLRNMAFNAVSGTLASTSSRGPRI